MAKNNNAERKKGIKAWIESARFTERIAEIKAITVNKRMGKSKGVLLITTLPSTTKRAPMIRSVEKTARARTICLGIAKASVVRVEKARGKIRRNNPNIKTSALSINARMFFLSSIKLATRL